jgi:thiamine-monophosphate kinase
MGAAPRLALLSMVVPPSLPLLDFDQIALGFAALAARHSLHLAGGNLTRSPGPLMLDVTVIGTVKRRQALTRNGAHPGDDLYVTGTIGTAAAGFRMLQEGGTLSSVPCVERYLRPEPRVRMGLLVSRNRAASACIDLSDGLADGVHQIAQASGVGITIDASAVPIDPAARAFFDARGLDAVTAALTGGDDYELLIAARPRASRRLAAAASHGGVTLTRIGRCTAAPAVTLQRGGVSQDMPLGYSHFAGPNGASLDEAPDGPERIEGSRTGA